MKFPIGIQLYTLRNELEVDFEGTLKKVKQLGYDGVEFAGLHGHSASYVKQVLSSLSLKAFSAHVSLEELIDSPDTVFKTYSEIGCSYIAIPFLSEQYRPLEGNFKAVFEHIKKLGTLSKQYGITLLYHNHNFEFQKIDGQYALDLLYDEIDANLLQLEPDTCWIRVAGEDPAMYISKYPNRVPLLHLKDFFLQSSTEKPNDLFKLMALAENPSNDSEEQFELRPLGQGMQDFSSILAVAQSIGTKYVIVEQDLPTPGKTPLTCIEESIHYLKSEVLR